MSQSQKPPKLVVTWAILIPVLLIITFVLSPAVIISVLAAAVVSPIVHTSVGHFYATGKTRESDFAKRMFGG